MRVNSLSSRLFLCIAAISLASPAFGLGGDRDIESARASWNEFLTRNCAGRQTEQTIRKLMEGKFRDAGMSRANSEVYRLLFLVDDFHQIEFVFSTNNRLLLTPVVEPKCRWLRMPNGDIRVVPDLVESEMESRVRELATAYIIDRTDHKRASLLVYCRRGNKPKTLDVVVTIDSLEVDTPSYLLEVTDDGRVNEKRFDAH